MGKRRKSDKCSMRRTPQNKVRRINSDLLRCEMALLTVEERLLDRELGKEAALGIERRKTRLVAHIERLKTCRSGWQRAGR